MTDSSFKIKNTLTVNNTVQVNAGGLYFSNTLSLNSSNYYGTSNNSVYLGGVLNTLYVNTSGSYTLAGILTYNANLFVNSSNYIILGNSTVNSSINATTITTNSIASFTISSTNTTSVPLNVLGAPSATVNLFQVSNSGSTIFAINASGVAIGNGAGLTLANNVLYSNTTDQVVSGGATVNSFSLGISNSTINNFTIDPGKCALQYLTNNTATTITAPVNDGYCIIQLLNGSSAGSVTFTGFTEGTNIGDALTTTANNKFKIGIICINSISSYSIQACQ